MKEQRIKEIMNGIGMPESNSLKIALEQVANEVAQEEQKKHNDKSVDDLLQECINGSSLIDTVSMLDVIAGEFNRRVVMYQVSFKREYPHPDVDVNFD